MTSSSRPVCEQVERHIQCVLLTENVVKSSSKFNPNNIQRANGLIIFQSENASFASIISTILLHSLNWHVFRVLLQNVLFEMCRTVDFAKSPAVVDH